MENGYTLIDTSSIYGNKEAVGRAIKNFLKEPGTSRDKLFITTKLWCADCKEPEKALRKSLNKLDLEYVDLYLTHWPIGIPNGGSLLPMNDKGKIIAIPYDEWNYIDTYKCMEKLVELGLTKSIGLSNFNVPKIKNILNNKEIKIKPVCNQVEMHPSLPQIELKD